MVPDADGAPAQTDEPGDGLSQRERRRQQFEKSKPKLSLSPAARKRMVIWGFVALIVGAVAVGMWSNQAKASECPGHWHSSYNVVVDGQRISFNHPQWNFAGDGGQLPLSRHMHLSSNDYEIHWEPVPTECQGMEDLFELIDTEVRSDRLILEGGHADLGQAGTFIENETHQLRLFRAHGYSQDWTEMSAKTFNDRQPQDGDKYLVIYGQYTDEELQAFQSQVPTPPTWVSANPRT